MKKTVRNNFRVEVTPRRLGDFGLLMTNAFGNHTEREEESACEAIADEIKRHVDGLPTSRDRGVQIIWDSENVCEFCGSQWTEDGDYNGGCCTKDVEAENARHPETAHERE